MSNSSEMPTDDIRSIRHMFADAEILLLDFDGPVCSVFAGFPASAVADQLRDLLTEIHVRELPSEVIKTEDPFDVFSFAASLGVSEAKYVEAALRAHEVEAVSTAQPTPGAHQLIREWHASGRGLAIVSNNSSLAVQSYLHLHSLASYVDEISARDFSDPSLLKPDPYLLHQVKMGIHSPKQGALSIFVGDSESDMQAASAANIGAIGYANIPGKNARLAASGANLIVTAMSTLVDALHGRPLP